MAKVSIAEDLKDEILKKFKEESKIIFRQMYALGQSPHKGKFLANIGGIVIKEIRYKSFRFYFITDGYRLNVMDDKKLFDLLIKFIAMSDKKEQQKVIEQIKDFLRNFGKRALD